MGRKSGFSAAKRRNEMAKRDKKKRKAERRAERKRRAELEAAGELPEGAEDLSLAVPVEEISSDEDMPESDSDEDSEPKADAA